MTTVVCQSRLAIWLALAVALFLASCGRPKVRAGPGDIEWVIVDCHDVGFWPQYVSRLDPEADGELISQLIAAVNNSRASGASESGEDGFLVFKLKGRGVIAFNFTAWIPEGVEIRPGYLSPTLPRLLDRVGKEKIGWKRGDSLPEVTIKEIQVWQYGDLVMAFDARSPSFAPLVSAGSEMLKVVDPRICTQDGRQENPMQLARHQGSPQFVLFLQEPVKMYKLVVWLKRGEDIARVKYKTFASSVIAIYQWHASGGIAGQYVASRDDNEKHNWYAWELTEGLQAARNMGKPDAYKAFDKLLEVYEKVAPPRR